MSFKKGCVVCIEVLKSISEYIHGKVFMFLSEILFHFHFINALKPRSKGKEEETKILKIKKFYYFIRHSRSFARVMFVKNICQQSEIK